MKKSILPVLFALGWLASLNTWAQSKSDLAILKGLSPVSSLANTPEGNAALAANYTVTGSLQTGAIRQSTLLPFPEQQQQALRDVFITYGNLAQLADGLGTTLGSAYIAQAHYRDRTHFTNVSQTIANLIAYAESITSHHAGTGKFYFANATTNGKTPVSKEATAILSEINGSTDIFGRNYHASAGANTYGNARPFQTEPAIVPIVGPDYFNTPTDNQVYNLGPMMDLRNSPSYPSGHTTYGYTGAILLALLVPDRYEQMITRGAEYGNDRILVGAHYAMDVLGGRTLALYDMAHLLANDPAYVGQSAGGVLTIKDFRAAVKAARSELITALRAACGESVATCAEEDIGRLNNPAANETFYSSTQTYNLPVVYEENATGLEDVATLAPEAGYLLTVAFPSLTLDEANRILTETEGPGGGFLDNGSGFGVYSRLDLYRASVRARTLVLNR